MAPINTKTIFSWYNMADTTSSAHDFERMLFQQVQSNKTLREMLGLQKDKQGSKTHQAREQAKQGKVIKHLDKHADTLRSGTVAIDETIRAFREFGKVLEGGLIGEMIIKYASDLTTTYKKLNDYGQTFGGSILNMQTAAADAALPLDKFAKTITEFGPAVSNFGTKRFFDLGKQVRSNISQFGMFGMTLDQINELVGDYGETQRVWGQISTLNDQKAAASMADLAEETSALSSLTGKSRQQTLKDMNAALRDSSLRVKMFQQQGAANQQYGANVSKAMAFFAAQTGEAGTLLTQMLAQTIGKGNAIFADQASTFFEAGAGGLVGSFNDMSKAIENAGDLTDEQLSGFINNFVDQGKALMPTLELQIKAGNKQAESIANMITETRKMSVEQLRTARAEQETKTVATKFLTNFENIWENISGRIRKGLFGAISSLTAWMDKPSTVASFNYLGDMMEQMGATIGTLLGEIFQPERLQRLGESLSYIITGAVSLGAALINGVVAITPVLNWVAWGLGKLFGLITYGFSIFTIFHDWMAKFSSTIADVVTGLGVLLLYLAVKRWRDVADKPMSIARAVINVANGTVNGGAANAAGNAAEQMLDANGKPKATVKGASPMSKMGRMTSWGKNLLATGVENIKAGAKGTALLGTALGGLALASDWLDNTKTREQKWDSTVTTVLGTAGGILGGVLGSVLGPAGTVAGGMLGSMAGNFVGGKINDWRNSGPTVDPSVAANSDMNVSAPKDRSIGGVMLDEEQFQKVRGLNGDDMIAALQTIAAQNAEALDLQKVHIGVDARASESADRIALQQKYVQENMAWNGI